MPDNSHAERKVAKRQSQATNELAQVSRRAARMKMRPVSFYSRSDAITSSEDLRELRSTSVAFREHKVLDLEQDWEELEP